MANIFEHKHTLYKQTDRQTKNMNDQVNNQISKQSNDETFSLIIVTIKYRNHLKSQIFLFLGNALVQSKYSRVCYNGFSVLHDYTPK